MSTWLAKEYLIVLQLCVVSKTPTVASHPIARFAIRRETNTWHRSLTWWRTATRNIAPIAIIPPQGERKAFCLIFAHTFSHWIDPREGSCWVSLAVFGVAPTQRQSSRRADTFPRRNNLFNLCANAVEPPQSCCSSPSGSIYYVRCATQWEKMLLKLTS